MASEDKGAGPQICQPVLYNNGGTIVSAMIYGLGTSGTVNLVYFNASGATSATNVPFNPNLAASSWAYPAFI